MKRSIVLGLFGLLIVALAAPVYAQMEYKFSGMVDTNYFYYRNIFKAPALYGTPTDQTGTGTGSHAESWNKDSLQYTNTRGRYKFDVSAGKDVSGTLFFETDATRWGETCTGYNCAGRWKADQTEVEVKNLYMTFAVPYFGVPVPMVVKLGVQPVAVRPEMVLATDGAGAVFDFNINPVALEAAWYKQVHDLDYKTNNDSQSFSLLGTAKVDTLTIGAYGLLFDMRTYPFNGGTSATTGTSADPSFKSDMWWFGAYSDGSLGPIQLKADVAFDYGKVKPFGATHAYEEVKYQGYATRLRLIYPWERFEFMLLGLYTSGPDAEDTDTNGLPGRTVADPAAGATKKSTNYRGYVVPPGSEENSSWGENAMDIVYGNFLLGRGPDYTGSNASLMSRGAIGGTWTVQAKTGYKMTPWYKISLSGAYIGDTTKNGNTLGNARRSNGISLRDDNDIGWEAALMNEVQIYKNLKWDTIFGYLWAGQALDQWGTGANVSPKDPYLAGTRVTFTW